MFLSKQEKLLLKKVQQHIQQATFSSIRSSTVVSSRLTINDVKLYMKFDKFRRGILDECSISIDGIEVSNTPLARAMAKIACKELQRRHNLEARQEQDVLNQAISRVIK